jgi:predicted permease
VIWGLIRDAFRRRRLDTDLEAQLAYHLDGLEAEGRAHGLSPEDARAAARRAMGGLTQVRDAYRDQLTIPVIEPLWLDTRYTLRALRRNPTFTLVVVLTLAVGIGANTAVFSVINSVLLKPLSYPRSEELVALRHVARGAESSALNLSPSMFLTYSEQNRTFQSLGAWTTTIGSVGLTEPELVRTALVSDGVLQSLAVPPAVGRWLSPDDQLGATRPPPSIFKAVTTVVLGYGLWQRRFGGDPSVVGRTVPFSARPMLVVGVMPRDFRIGDMEPDVIWPAGFDRERLTLAGSSGATFNYHAVARLKPGVTIEQANADVERMIPMWMQSWSDGPGTTSRIYESWKLAPALRPLKDDVVGSVSDMLWVVMATIGLVMLIACANVANLMLVRGEVRQRELSVRAALGAGRGRIVRSLFIESVVLGLIGGAIGTSLAYGGLRVLVAAGPANLPRLNEISLDARTFAFTAVLSVLSSVLFGLIPALRYTGPWISAALAGVSRTASLSRDRLHTRSVLIVVQVAIAFVLLVSAGLMIRTLDALRTVQPGFSDPEHLLIMRMFFSAQVVAEAERTTRLQNDIQDKLSAVPGVISAAFGSAMPMEGFASNLGVVNAGVVRPDDRPDQMLETLPPRLFKYASPGFFKTAGTRVLAGREITWTEVYGLRPVVMISESLARELWGAAAAAIGKHLRQGPDVQGHEVIGVVEDVRENGLDQPAAATVYWPTMSSYLNRTVAGPTTIRQVTFVVRSTRAATEGFLNQLRQAVWSVDSSQPVTLQTMREVYDRSLARTSFTLVMLAIAASMALLLGVVGIYGVIAYAVSQRRRELGIRATLGAGRRELSGMFIRHSLLLSGIGIAIGLVAAAAMTRLMSTLLYGITPLDPVTYVTVPLVLMMATVIASYVPARRAASADPVEALKEE